MKVKTLFDSQEEDLIYNQFDILLPSLRVLDEGYVVCPNMTFC